LSLAPVAPPTAGRCPRRFLLDTLLGGLCEGKQYLQETRGRVRYLSGRLVLSGHRPQPNPVRLSVYKPPAASPPGR
jgi:hypothetical protein